MKKVILVNQAKGGAGKSVLTFLLAEKYPKAAVIDMDDASKTTTMQLAYRNPPSVTFLNSNRVIDRGLFSSFLEKLSTSTPEFYISDLGASISEQLPHYFSDVSDFLSDILPDLGIQLDLYIVVGGSNIFTQTMSYLSDVVDSIGKAKHSIHIQVFKNEYYEFGDDQTKVLNKYCKDHNLTIHSFDISRDKNESTQTRIKEVLKSGKGVEAFSSFSKFYFTSAIKKLSV